MALPVGTTQDKWLSGYDGGNLMDLVRNNKDPFQGVLDVKLLIQEVEQKLHTMVTDIPVVHKGSNNYVGLRSILTAFLV